MLSDDAGEKRFVERLKERLVEACLAEDAVERDGEAGGGWREKRSRCWHRKRDERNETGIGRAVKVDEMKHVIGGRRVAASFPHGCGCLRAVL